MRVTSGGGGTHGARAPTHAMAWAALGAHRKIGVPCRRCSVTKCHVGGGAIDLSPRKAASAASASKWVASSFA